MANVFSHTGKSIVTNRILGAGTEPKNLGIATGTGTALVSDPALFGPEPETRVAGTSTQQTTTQPNDTYQVITTITASAPRAITNAGLFDSTSAPGSTTLSASCTSGASTVAVTANASFPGSGNYYILVEAEAMQVTGGQGSNTWTVSRGVLGSSAASHASSVQVSGAGQAGVNGGNMLLKSDFSVVNLAASDSIQVTFKLQMT